MKPLTALANTQKATLANTGAKELSVLLPISDIQLHSDFKDLFPINDEMVDRIAASIAKSGYDASQPVHVWKEKMLLVDGHHRRLAALKTGMKEIPVFFHSFPGLHSALEYAIMLQVVRRNLSDSEIYRMMLRLDILKERGVTKENTENKSKQGKSAEATAKKIGVSRAKIERARTVRNKASPEIKEAVESGEMSINKAYTIVTGESEAKEKIKQKKEKQQKTERERTWYYGYATALAYIIDEFQYDIVTKLLKKENLSIEKIEAYDFDPIVTLSLARYKRVIHKEEPHV